MDVQLKRGFLDACVLKVLSNGESYGYQILKDLGGVIQISESTLYPILKRLEAGGCLQTRTTTHNGRLRKYYCITPMGLQRLYDSTQGIQELLPIVQFLTGGNVS